PRCPRAGFAGTQPGIELTKEPRIQQSPAADGDAGTAGFVEHASRIGQRAHVAITDDGDARHRFDDRANAVQLDAAAAALLARAAVDRDGGDADVFESLGEEWGRKVLIVPAETHLHGDRHADRLYDALDQGGGPRRVAHHRRPAAAAHDL